MPRKAAQAPLQLRYRGGSEGGGMPGKGADDVSVTAVLRQRELGLRHRDWHRRALEPALEEGFVRQHSSVDYDLSEEVLSTIAIDVSSDGQYVVTTHGDHTVKIFCYASNRLLRVLHGHPRTPWTAKFHPTDSNIVASGCLGGEVRLWDIKQGACVKLQVFPTSIISIAFFPLGPSIAVASGAALFAWNYNQPFHNVEDNVVPLVQHSRTIKAVTFHPGGRHMLLAAPESPRNHQLNSTPCRLFSLQVRLNEAKEIIGQEDDGVAPTTGDPADLRHLSDLPTVLPRVHLYSDGGLDISKDGRYLFVCAVLTMAVPTSQLVQMNRQQAIQSPGGISDIPDSFMVPVIHHRNMSSESRTRVGSGGLPQIPQTEDHVCLFRLNARSDGPPTVTLIRSCHIPRSLMLAITSAKLSPTCTYGLLGYGVRKNGVVERHPRSSVVACELLRLRDMRSVALMEDDVDEVNIAHFHSLPGNGVVYGTKRGRVRKFGRSVDAPFVNPDAWPYSPPDTPLDMQPDDGSQQDEVDMDAASSSFSSTHCHPGQF